MELNERFDEQFQASIDLLSQLIELPAYRENILNRFNTLYADGHRSRAINECNAMIEQVMMEQGIE